MRKRLTYTIAVIVSICVSMLLFACSEKDKTYTASYSAGDGGYVYYVNEQGYQERTPYFEIGYGGDVTEVTAAPIAGYAFVKWSDGVTTATRQDRNVTADIRVQAIFIRTEYYITYRAAVTDGYIDGETNQTVAPNADAEPVTAVPNNGYIFDKWTDGITTAARQDKNVASNISVNALFKKEEYTLKYIASEHGGINGETEQTVVFMENGATVTAVADRGYEFVKWSDGETSAERSETSVDCDLQVTAEFAPITREYELNYRKTLDSELNKEKLTLTYDAMDDVRLPVPEREHFIFDGWYYGDVKVADENGELVIDDEFVIDEVIEDILGRKQDIKAKWRAEETFPFKILVVYVTRIEARLYDMHGIYHDIDYTMTELQRRFCEESTKLLKQTMDEMCDGLVDFQVDEYYTTQAVTSENFSQSNIEVSPMFTTLFPSAIPEVHEMLSDYDCTISVFGFGGDKPDSETIYLFQSASGNATMGECSVYLDDFIFGAIVDVCELTDILNGERKEFWLDGIGVFTHEIAHTIEMRIDAYSYHIASVGSHVKYGIHRLDMDRLYYTQSIEQDGQLVGIPYEFWKGEIAHVKYEVTKDEHGNIGNMGHVIFDDSNIEGRNWAEQEVVYGWDANTVKAEPSDGYRFVRWSDGVLTPERKDRNITSDFSVTAIFEPIFYTIKIVSSEGGGLQRSADNKVSDSITVQVRLAERTDYVRAVAEEGYRFVGWSDGTTDNPWVKFIQVSDLDMFDENNTYILTAIFEKID